MSLGLGGSIPFTNTFINPVTPIIPDVPYGVSHLLFNETSMVDLNGGTWTRVNTPTISNPYPYLPRGMKFSTTTRFTAPSPLWNFAGSWWGACVWAGTGSGGSVIIGSTNMSTDGWYIGDNGGVASGNGAAMAQAVGDAGIYSASNINVVVFGFNITGNVYPVQTNGGSFKSAARATTVSSSVAQVGSSITNSSFAGVIYEVLMTSGQAPNAQLFDSVSRSIFNNLGMNG